MIKLIPIKVECLTDHKADEYPKCFYRDNIRYEIEEITDRWYQGEQNPEWPVSDYFRVVTASKEQHIIKHALEGDEWYLCIADF